jgi:hypothetical protein
MPPAVRRLSPRNCGDNAAARPLHWARSARIGASANQSEEILVKKQMAVTTMAVSLVALAAVPACVLEETDAELAAEETATPAVKDDDAPATDGVPKAVYRSGYLVAGARDPAVRIIDPEEDQRASRARVGDFNGDGRDDLLTVDGTTLLIRYQGIDDWSSDRLAETDLPLSALRVGDFDGDGTSDVFRSTGGGWFIAKGGKAPWVPMGGSGAPLADLAFHDFDGRGATDILWMTGRSWKLWTMGNQWRLINDAPLRVSDVDFGDFNGDGATDVLATQDGIWTVYYSAIGGGQEVRTSTVTTQSLQVGDFDGNGRDEVLRFFRTSAGWRWMSIRVDVDEQEDWALINTQDAGITRLIGNFDGGRRTDVLVFRQLQD